MKTNRTLQEIKEYASAHKWKKKWLTVVICLSMVVVFLTTYALIMPALTLESDVYCGQTEHTHSRECYTENLVCPLTEGEGHIHSEECYGTEKVLVCTETESEGHVHSEECYDADNALVCTETESHTHSDECYSTEKALKCTETESEGHTHSEECYEFMLSCGKEEHVHTDECYIDTTADVETAKDWEETFSGVELTGVWAKDLVALAETQLGYTESSVNYIVTEDREPKGYTRYGEWYQKPYEEWDAMFVAFCLNYAKIPVEYVPQTDSCQNWIEMLSGRAKGYENFNLYTDAKDYSPSPGDLIFFDKNQDGSSEHMGIVAEYMDAVYNENAVLETPAKLRIIEGNVSNQVKDNTYALDDAQIMGYGILPENPEKQNIAVGEEENKAVDAGEPEEKSMATALDAGEESTTTLYVSALSISNMKTGTEPFDQKNGPGNDMGADDNIVRTFDNISYNLDVSVNDSNGDKHKEVKLGLEIILDKDMTEAMFDTDLFKYLDDYTITYYDADNNKVAEGQNGLPKYSANQHASGSNEDNAYSTSVVKQVLSGYLTASNTDGSEFASLQKTLQAGINVKASCDGDTIQPSFRCWVDGESTGKTAISQEIKVSAAANYNVALTRSTSLVYGGSFDLLKGEEATEQTAEENKATGLMLGYCVTVQLYNEEENKGLKGIELPKGEISAKIDFRESASSTAELVYEKGFTPILWDYRTDGNAVSEANTIGAWGRKLKWGGIDNTARAHWAAPGNSLKQGGRQDGTCYHGGIWSMDESDKVTDVSSLTGTSSGPYNIKIIDYDFDLDDYIFPDRTQGTTSVVYTDNIGCFSAGYLEVLLQYDENQLKVVENSTSIYMTTTVDNFKATSMSGDIVTKEMVPLDVTGLTYVDKTDNKAESNIVVKSPGSIDKVNSIARGPVPGDIATNYMGIAGTYWTGECGDPATFAGSEVYLAGQFYLSSNASVVITDYNYLQIFDSKGFTIDASNNKSIQVAKRGNMEIAGGTTNFLYAADPDYPGGYDSNVSEAYTDSSGKLVASAEYMYDVQEKDLIYFESLEALEGAGYECIGVMLEARGVKMKPYGWSGISIPVKVSDDEKMIGKTLCTINRVSAWTDNAAADLTWKGAMTESQAATVAEKEIYQNPGYRLDTKDCVNSNSGKSKYEYKKTEYDNGNIVKETHLNGKYGGMSLLILGYEASMKLDTVNSKVFYDLDKNERTANYVISNIQTKVLSENNHVTETGEPMVTDLTIETTLDKGLMLDQDTLCMDGKSITGRSDSATELTYLYKDSQGEERTITYTVYYEYDAESQKLMVHISDAPVGVGLPDITFSAAIGEIGSSQDVTNGDELTVTTKITGQGDRRAYSTAAGNWRTKTIEVGKLNSTSLVKAVHKEYAELNESFSYTLSYTNNGTGAMSGTLYLYDIMPYNGDASESKYTDSSDNHSLGIRSLSAHASREDNTNITNSNLQVRLYYSTADPRWLTEIIEFRNMPPEDIYGLCQSQLLGNAMMDDKGFVYFFQDESGQNINLYSYTNTGAIDASNFTVDENGYVETVSINAKKLIKATGVQVDSENRTITFTSDEEPVEFKTGTYKKLFLWAGDITNDQDLLSKEEFADATAIFAIARNLAAGETIGIDVEVRPQGNEAGDIYFNSAHSWISGTSGQAELDSNTVNTRVISRAISGVVWYDFDLDGMRDDDEELLKDVDCTLFKWDSDKESYVPCEMNVTGEKVETIRTDENGAYSFSKLTDGEYIVAFKGDGLEKYTDATVYQVNHKNDAITNDGMALSDERKISGIEGYQYAIYYNLSGNVEKTSSITLHPIYNKQGDVTILPYLVDHVESYEHQDLGVIIAGYKLPETGGDGTLWFTIGGLLLMAGAGYCGYIRKRRRERRGKN